jgi:hypothetical protein
LQAETFNKIMTLPPGSPHHFPNSAAHLMLTLLGRMGASLQLLVMLTGLGGRLGSTPGLLVGMGFGS